jgi:hypothetical protein
MQSPGERRTIAQRSYLPRELFRRGSDLDRLITIAGDSAADNTFGATATVAVTRGMLRRLCPDYRPGRTIDLDVMCGSGEADGRALRHECRTCLVGQFSTSGEFFGDLIPDSEDGQPAEFVGVAIGGKEAQAL